MNDRCCWCKDRFLPHDPVVNMPTLGGKKAGIVPASAPYRAPMHALCAEEYAGRLADYIRER